MGQRVTTKVSKKLKLSKGKMNYRKLERKLIHRYGRRQWRKQLTESGVAVEKER
jgi:hypothetical protein